jgi:hypothetical protein
MNVDEAINILRAYRSRAQGWCPLLDEEEAAALRVVLDELDRLTPRAIEPPPEDPPCTGRLATIDPAPGDLVDVRGDEREVIDADDDGVVFRFHTGAIGSMTLDQWREWAKGSLCFITKGGAL